MTEIQRIRKWMDETGYTVSSLAKEIGMSYDGTYQVLSVRERLSNGFKFRFINRFGIETAKAVFDFSPAGQILPAKAGELVPDALDETQCPASERPAV